ncbi:MAG: hypothetical protein HY892_01730 [Deltaproteobacteria bacterium]|nr:hypothetical protein [Deltaproteobacteria bacterium]
MKKAIYLFYLVAILSLFSTPTFGQFSRILPSERDLQSAIQSGVTEQDAVFKFGQPKRINKSYRMGHEFVQWAYDGYYIYFSNGRMYSYDISYR